MHSTPTSLGHTIAACLRRLVVFSLCAVPPWSFGNPATVGSEAAAACERAARQVLLAQAPGQIEFALAAAPAAQANNAKDGPTVLRGSARWRSATGLRSFSFSCNIDPLSTEAVGLVMRETTPAAAQAAPSRKLAEPDLSHLSPVDCESGAAAALKRRWPSVSQISFDGATRSFLQKSADRAELHGQGRALPAADSPSTHFGFDCEIDPRNGRVLGVRLSG